MDYSNYILITKWIIGFLFPFIFLIYFVLGYYYFCENNIKHKKTKRIINKILVPYAISAILGIGIITATHREFYTHWDSDIPYMTIVFFYGLFGVFLLGALTELD
ncbi:hypothetical protein HY636_03055 [Candidatus Woesearchaeota archaeon]|nr:hypothetical protein [Candidatus Woesearchaeota archaeon]